MNRRSVLGLSLLAAVPAPILAHADELAIPPTVIPLWPSLPPGGEGVQIVPHVTERSPTPDIYHDRVVSGVFAPEVTIFRPADSDGSAVLLFPGGGYSIEGYDWEGTLVAQTLMQKGITVAVLTYRLPSEGWANGRDVPLQDAQRAMRLMRRIGATQWGLDPARIGVIGFSAGGHLAGSLATRYAATVYAPVDDSDTLDARPTFAGYAYPVVSMLPPLAHEASCEKLLGPQAPADLRAAYSIERHVTSGTPPSFLTAALDDPVVPADNTLVLLAALRAAGVPCELHVFERGGHGYGLRGGTDTPADVWLDLFLRWGAQRGYFKRVSN